MKNNYLILFFLLFAFLNTIWANENCKTSLPITENNNLTNTFLIVENSNNLSEPTPFSRKIFAILDERKGCCSWHGGVCGCTNEKVVCCDRTMSPSCGCFQ